MESGSYRLPLYGAARLERDGEVVPIRRKALAILYFLALEGTARRELVAELLWPGKQNSVNLRAELHHLRKKLGIDPAGSRRMLRLPAGVALDITRQNGNPMEGLEGLSPEFDVWLTRKRFELEMRQQQRTPLRNFYGLAGELPVPGLWILAGPIGSGKRRMAQALAGELELPFVTGWQPGFDGLVYLEEPLPSFEELKPRNWPRVLVVARPALGEEPSLILRLRATYPAERTRYLEVPRLSFGEAAALLGEMPFAQAARYYLRSHGREELLTEMVSARHETPLKYRAIYKIEARRLRRKSRLTLERISVCPETISPELAQRVGSEEDLEELERRGWLVYDGGWRFTDPVARRALAHDLPAGLKHQYHLRAAAVWEEAGKPLYAGWHRLQAGEMVEVKRLAEMEGNPYAAAVLGAGEDDQPPRRQVRIGDPHVLLEQARHGPGWEINDGCFLLLRPEYTTETSWLEFEPCEEDAVLRISGQLLVFAPLAGALKGEPPLTLHVGAHRVALAPLEKPAKAGNIWLLPAKGDFEYRLLLAAGERLAISSSADEVAARFTVEAYARSNTRTPTEAVDLSGASLVTTKTQPGYVGRS